MTKSELRQKSLDKGSLFFTRNNMRFAGDTMSNFGLRSAVIDTWTEKGVEVWELYRKKAVKCRVHSSNYFRKSNLEDVRKKRVNN